jgi:hypothetical protein
MHSCMHAWHARERQYEVFSSKLLSTHTHTHTHTHTLTHARAHTHQGANTHTHTHKHTNTHTDEPERKRAAFMSSKVTHTHTHTHTHTRTQLYPWAARIFTLLLNLLLISKILPLTLLLTHQRAGARACSLHVVKGLQTLRTRPKKRRAAREEISQRPP